MCWDNWKPLFIPLPNGTCARTMIQGILAKFPGFCHAALLPWGGRGTLFCLTSSETNQTEESWLTSRIKTLLCTHFWRGDGFLWIFSLRCWQRALEEPITNSQGGNTTQRNTMPITAGSKTKKRHSTWVSKVSNGMQGTLQPA